MIDTIHFIYPAEYADLNFEYFNRIKNRKGVYKAQINTILFNFYSANNILHIVLNAHRVLEKFDIKLSDLALLQCKIDQAISKVIDNYNSERLEISRCDFCA